MVGINDTAINLTMTSSEWRFYATQSVPLFIARKYVIQAREMMRQPMEGCRGGVYPIYTSYLARGDSKSETR